jgi:hypothetical protein
VAVARPAATAAAVEPAVEAATAGSVAVETVSVEAVSLDAEGPPSGVDSAAAVADDDVLASVVFPAVLSATPDEAAEAVPAAVAVVATTAVFPAVGAASSWATAESSPPGCPSGSDAVLPMETPAECTTAGAWAAGSPASSGPDFDEVGVRAPPPSLPPVTEVSPPSVAVRDEGADGAPMLPGTAPCELSGTVPPEAPPRALPDSLSSLDRSRFTGRPSFLAIDSLHPLRLLLGGLGSRPYQGM